MADVTKEGKHTAVEVLLSSQASPKFLAKDPPLMGTNCAWDEWFPLFPMLQVVAM